MAGTVLLTFILKWLIANYKAPKAFQIWAKTIEHNLRRLNGKESMFHRLLELKESI